MDKQSGCAGIRHYVMWLQFYPRSRLSKSDTMRRRPFRQRIHVTLRKPTKPRKEIAMMQPTPNESRIPTDELVDIREVSVDKNLPKEERIAAFIRQIKNPYRFRCGDFVVNACFAGNGVTLEECLQGILR